MKLQQTEEQLHWEAGTNEKHVGSFGICGRNCFAKLWGGEDKLLLNNNLVIYNSKCSPCH